MRPKLVGKDNINGWQFDIYVAHGRRRLYLWRRDSTAGKPRRQEGPAAAEAAVPANVGLYGCPTTVNNVESIAVAPTSCGAARPGSPRSAGPTMSAPSCFASPASRAALQRRRGDGAYLRELIERHCGGIRGGWDNLKAVIPGGSSVRMVPAELIIAPRWISTAWASCVPASAPRP